ncbi:hypothetical protein LL033_10000 [Clostridium estertheticum]|uniref:hypothetical protein n=1 Tax=Clostridium estertheticum TaxID=238834 RepID=UPI001C0E689C|nr:hypothetical protein [Clostridium estertheticum]MBU3217801.1 hypothetical protein [Clostridium estertheticum]WAG57488.1 hypothetical protein LL033_10000 [Clostridium estertheticum]
MIQITQRDKGFLLKVNETGACSSKLPLTIYPTRYCRSRLELMEREKIINRKYGLIMIGVEGRKYLERIGVTSKLVDNLSIVTQRRLARTSELKYLMPTMEVVTSAQYKKENNLNRGMLFVSAATTKERSTYLIYDIPKQISNDSKVQISRELKNKRDEISHAIIFTRNADFAKVLTTSNVYINELLLLPPNESSFGLLNEMAKGFFDRRIICVAFPKLSKEKAFYKKQTQYIIGNNFYLNLVLNNILSSYDMLAVQADSSSDSIYYVVCLHEQQAFFQQTMDQLNLKKLDVQLVGIDEDSF